MHNLLILFSRTVGMKSNYEYDLYKTPLSPDDVYSLFSIVHPLVDRNDDLHVGTQNRNIWISMYCFSVRISSRYDYLAGWDLHKTNQPGLKPWPNGDFLRLGVNDAAERRRIHGHCR